MPSLLFSPFLIFNFNSCMSMGRIHACVGRNHFQDHNFNFSFSLIATTASRPNFGYSFLGLPRSYMLFSCSLSFWRFSCLVFCNCSLAEAVSHSLFSVGNLEFIPSANILGCWLVMSPTDFLFFLDKLKIY